MISEVIVNNPSFKRLLKLIKLVKKNSILRALQYEMLAQAKIKGATLDYGGGRNSKYRDIIETENIYSINIDPHIKPTWLIEPGGDFPNKEIRFNTIISINTLEHIYNPEEVILKMYKSLDKDGEIYISTPFIFQIHGHPMDYLRATPEWYIKTGEKIGFSECKVTLLHFGKSTIINSLGLSRISGYFGRILSLSLDYFAYNFKCRIRRLLKLKYYHPTTPIGIWVYYKK